MKKALFGILLALAVAPAQAAEKTDYPRLGGTKFGSPHDYTNPVMVALQSANSCGFGHHHHTSAAVYHAGQADDYAAIVNDTEAELAELGNK
jgi:hypothetical protein